MNVAHDDSDGTAATRAAPASGQAADHAGDRYRCRRGGDQLAEEADEEARPASLPRGIGTTSCSWSSLWIALRLSRRRRISSLTFSVERREPRLVGGDRDVAQPEAVALGAQVADVEQRLGRRGHRAVAVLPLGADVVDLGGAS